MRERVETRRFSSGDTCDHLLKEIEQIYAARFGTLRSAFPLADILSSPII